MSSSFFTIVFVYFWCHRLSRSGLCYSVFVGIKVIAQAIHSFLSVLDVLKLQPDTHLLLINVPVTKKPMKM